MYIVIYRLHGGRLKEIGTDHWASPNEGATNETGFTALPGGFRTFDGLFSSFVVFEGYWWSSTESPIESYAYHQAMYFNHGYMNRLDINKRYGFSVRCLKDNM